jgi:hypothetical protein
VQGQITSGFAFAVLSVNHQTPAPKAATVHRPRMAQPTGPQRRAVPP